MEFLFPEVALYPYKSTVQPCMEYYCHVWAGAPSCYSELLDKLQKQICRTIGPSLATSVEPLAHSQKVTSLSLFYRYYFARCLSELAQLVPLTFSWGRSTRFFNRLHDFSVTIPRRYKDVYVNSLFPSTARIWNSLPIKWFPLTYNLNDFKFKINSRFFLKRFPVCFNLFVLVFLVALYLVVAVQPCMECIPIEKSIFCPDSTVLA